MRRRQFLSHLLGGLAATGAGSLAAWPQVGEEQKLRLRYRLSERGVALGEATINYQISDGGYRVESHAIPTGKVARLFSGELKETSVGDWNNGGPEPLSYTFLRSGPKPRDRLYEFDYNVGQVATVGLEPIPIEVGVQDDVSHILALSLALQSGSAAAEFRVLRGSKARLYDYRFEVGATESLQLAGREWSTQRVSRTTSRKKYDLTLWCAAELGFLPVRQVRIQRKNERRSELELIGWERG